MILGKFMPPHLGHVYLADFAKNFCERLTILVCSIAREPIPGRLRYEWMREMFPDCDVVHVTDELPQEPAEHPDFWNLWRKTIRRAMPEPPDFVFASEAYGQRLAAELGATFIPVDVGRGAVPVSGTAVRTRPMANWAFIPPVVRPYFVKRVCVYGPESTGKTTLARDLARHFKTTWAPEYARHLLDLKDGRCDPEDFPLIARGQAASEDALARQANRVLICDTDAVTTAVWHDALVGPCPAWLTEAAAARNYDLYLLLDVDVPWVSDGQRFFAEPDRRRAFFDACEAALRSRGRRYVRIGGDWSARLDAAVRAVEAVVQES
jgi:NadR type nicotinamide-nucleotide adenylyltransferase